MAESVENKRFCISSGVNTSSNATFRLCDLKSNLMFLLRKIRNTIIRHAELVSASHVTETLKRVQGDNKIEHKTLCHSELGSESKGSLDNVFKTAKKALAFTLAETLIVMGIIGVVAALTIPNLNASTADKEKVAKLKKIYSNLEDAIGRAQAVYGPTSDWSLMTLGGNEASTRAAERIGDFLKVSKTCGLTANSACLPTNVKYLNGTAFAGGTSVSYELASGNESYVYKYILADGTGIGIQAACGHVFFTVDIDGPSKGAQTIGKDLFGFNVDLLNSNTDRRDILLTDATTNGLMNSSNLTANFKSGLGLTTWVIQNDNMDYLKATDGKCKSNTRKVLDWTNTSCK
ncbi:MAG: hypothetical protein DKM24_03615 [Candidatus Melainabacteria bacterium]|nr:MAG: hypothetical protein DKM24_03615 [Candidatus Melainabacteria bacterium]